MTHTSFASLSQDTLLGASALSGVAARCDLMFGIACVVIATVRAIRVARKERGSEERIRHDNRLAKK